MMGNEEYLNQKIDEVIKKEGGEKYTNDPNDSGGPTRFGVTQFVAQANGYYGDMRTLPISRAILIYKTRYWYGPKYSNVAQLSWPIANKLLDTGINTGTGRASTFLQQWLNAFNLRGAYWPDMTVDGAIGNITLHALDAYLQKRGEEGEAVMVEGLNNSQGEFYRLLSQARQKDEDFIYGWMRTRVLRR